MSPEKAVEKILLEAGITINGDKPWDIKLNNPEKVGTMFRRGNLGFGEGYMHGWWDCDRVDELFNRILTHDVAYKLNEVAKIKLGTEIAIARVKQFFGDPHIIVPKTRELKNDAKASNALFQAMLDRRMTYSCAYWNGAENLDAAQENKLDLLCRKAGLQPGMRVLDIGCGWGCFTIYAAEKYGVTSVGIAANDDQVKLGNKMAAEKELDVTFLTESHLEHNPDEPYDAVVSLGAFEHIRNKDYGSYFSAVRRLMKPEATFVLQCIGQTKTTDPIDPWMLNLIFTNGHIPNLQELAEAFERNFIVDDMHNLGEDYDKTICAWVDNIDSSWKDLKKYYEEDFYRMWRYYLLCCAGAFRARELQVWQFVLTQMHNPKPNYVRAV